MQYVVRGLTPDNRIDAITVDALDEDAARREALAQQRIQALSVKPLRRGLPGLSGVPSRGSRFLLLPFSQELLALLSAGLGVVEALEALLENERSPQAVAVIQGLLAKVREGHPLSRAMQARPDVFPALFVGMVQAAEGTSDLPGALARYAAFQTRLDAVKGRVVSAAELSCGRAASVNRGTCEVMSTPRVIR